MSVGKLQGHYTSETPIGYNIFSDDLSYQTSKKCCRYEELAITIAILMHCT